MRFVTTVTLGLFRRHHCYYTLVLPDAIMLWNAVGSAKTAYPISHILVASRSKSFPYPSLWLAAIVWGLSLMVS